MSLPSVFPPIFGALCLSDLGLVLGFKCFKFLLSPPPSLLRPPILGVLKGRWFEDAIFKLCVSFYHSLCFPISSFLDIFSGIPSAGLYLLFPLISLLLRRRSSRVGLKRFSTPGFPGLCQPPSISLPSLVFLLDPFDPFLSPLCEKSCFLLCESRLDVPFLSTPPPTLFFLFNVFLFV